VSIRGEKLFNMTLPKFLLAWSDFNWLWLYAQLRPAKDARWSLRRVMVLTALKAAGGAGFGLVLSLLFFRQPTGWLPWLLGLFAGCVGLCWLGVTAICWNQRAAQLRANPTLPTALPHSRFRFGRWCLGAIYLAILGLITPFALFITVENLRGEWAWKREHARLVAAGEKLTFREILGPEIPPEQNAGAAKIFAPFFDYRRDQPKRLRTEEGLDDYASGLVWPSSNALARIEFALQLPDDYLPKSERSAEAQTPAVNLTNWSIAFRTLVQKPKTVDNVPPKVFQLPEPGNPALDVLAGLLPAEPVLSEICAAAALPRSQFPIHFDAALDALLAHLSKIKEVQRTLRLRCAAHLATGQTGAAFADATNALNVAELLREEPLLISQLVRYAQASIAASTLWQGLAKHQWSDAQLAEFQRQLAQIDYLPGLVRAFEGERALGIAGMERLIHESPARASFLGEDSSRLRLLISIHRSMLRQNQVALAHYQSAMLTGLRQGITNSAQSGLTTLLDSDEARLEWHIPTTYSPFRVMVAMLAPATGKAMDKTARAQTTVKLASVACALERYRLARGSYPETLGQLAPQFAASLPLDPMVNQPFRYQRTDDGWFLLYSVGPNGKDDGGVMRSNDKGDKDDQDWPWPVPTRPTHPRLF